MSHAPRTPAGTYLDDRALAALRVAATVVHVVPALRCRVSHSEGVLVDVGRDLPTRAEGPLVLTPCAFRRAVIDARRTRDSGRGVHLLGLAAGADPRIEIGVPPCGRSFPGGIHRTPHRDGWLHVFGTTLDVEVAYEAGREVVAAAGALPGVEALGLRHDAGTDVTVVFARTEGRTPDTADGVVEVMSDLMARYAMTAMVQAVTAG